MRILFVCSKNSGKIAPFIQEQIDVVSKYGVNVDIFTIIGKGVRGYLKNTFLLDKRIKEFQPDLIHAHYGLSGLLANLQRKVPVITTYHGSDINDSKAFLFSKLSIRLSAWNIFVSLKNIQKAGVKKQYSLIPCGVDTGLFHPMDKKVTQERFGFSMDEKLILFSGSFDDRIKNSELAIKAVRLLPEARLIELKGYSRQEVAELINAVDVCLMTSFTEGSPQFIKEAMACNCPIVSVDVGDVKYLTEGVDGCFICNTYQEVEIVEKLKAALQLNIRTNGRKRILEKNLDLKSIADQIFQIYNQISNRTR